MINNRMLVAAALFGASLAVAFAQGCCGGQGSQSGSDTQIQTDTKGVQKATIVVDNGFSPASLTVKAGKPVEITFDTKNQGCVSAVVFNGLNIRKDLTNGKKTTVSFTPKKGGKYTFACPMNMVKGTLTVK